MAVEQVALSIVQRAGLEYSGGEIRMICTEGCAHITDVALKGVGLRDEGCQSDTQESERNRAAS